MSEQAERLRRIAEQVNALLQRHDADKARIAELETRARDLAKEEQVLKARIARLEQENEVLRNTRTAPAGLEDGTKQRIDDLVNEIDRCLELLNR